MNLWRIRAWPAARFTRNEGTVKGGADDPWAIKAMRTACAIAPNPPTPEAMTVAVRSRSASVSGCQPACAMASCAAAGKEDEAVDLALVLGCKHGIRVETRLRVLGPRGYQAPDEGHDRESSGKEPQARAPRQKARPVVSTFAAKVTAPHLR